MFTACGVYAVYGDKNVPTVRILYYITRVDIHRHDKFGNRIETSPVLELEI